MTRRPSSTDRPRKKRVRFPDGHRPRRGRNTKRIGDKTELILRRWFEGNGWHVEKARVSRGQFDLVCWKEGGRKFIQAKTNMRTPTEIKQFFKMDDPVFLSSWPERLWIIRWTKGPHAGYLEVHGRYEHEFVPIPEELR